METPPGLPAAVPSAPGLAAAGTAAVPSPPGVTRPIGRELLRLALPVLASQVLRLGYQYVDAFWVRGLGVDATAAVTTSVFVMWAILSVNDVVSMGVSAYASQLLGAGERARAGVVAYRGVRASALLGLIGTGAGLFAARAIYELMHADAGIAQQGARYLSIVLGAAPLPMIALTCETVMRAAGDTRTPLAIDLCAVALNAVLAPFLIYGWGPFPRLGIAGAALATVIAQALMVACYLLLAWRGHPAFPWARRAPGATVRLAAMAKVGAPGSLIGILFSVVYVGFARAAGAFGAAALAVVGIANRIEALHFVSSVALGVAGGTLVGQNLGAGRPERAQRALRLANLWNLGVSAVLTTLFLAVPGTFVSWFTPDRAVHAIGVPYLRIIALCLPFVGIEIVTAEAILASGHTVALSVIYTSISLARIPLAFLATRWAGGPLGIAWLIASTSALRTMLILAWAARGTWKTGLAAQLGRGG